MHTTFAGISTIQKKENGSALIITLIILAILSALGYAALDVADLNLFMAANDRDTKEAFFKADSGVNIGKEYLKSLIDDGNNTILEDDANLWSGNYTHNKDNSNLYIDVDRQIYVRAGLLDYVDNPHSIQFNEYLSSGMSLSKSLTPIFLIRSYSEGKRNSRSQVDLGFRDRPLM